jgi:hypothetical protein
MTELRDHLAAQIAAALAHSTLPPADIARRAYAVADAMIFERAAPCLLDDELVAERLDPEVVPERWEGEPSYDPRWELSPRWSREDLAALEARRAGPGLAKPSTPPASDQSEDDAQKTG